MIKSISQCNLPSTLPQNNYDPISDLINKILIEEESKYIEKSIKKLLILTWNLASSDPVNAVKIFLAEYGDDLPDCIVFGFQEVDMKVSTIVMGDKVDRSDLEERLFQALPDPNKYIYIARHHGGVSLMICVKLELKNQVKSAEFCVIPLGRFNMANKCAVMASIILGKSAVCFVCAHFPANTNEVNLRNEAFHYIMQTASITHHSKSSYSISDHDFIFFFGDLNYRVDAFSSSEMYIDHKKFRYDSWFRFDQLYMEKKIGKIFQNFDEHDINFPPTYKLSLGGPSLCYYDDRRTPSWTDRILYKSLLSDCIRIEQYDSISHLPLISDHLPVYANFKVEFNLINQQIYSDVYNKASIKAASEIIAPTPKIMLSSQYFNFHDIHFYKKNTQTLVIKNIGLNDVTFEVNCLNSDQSFTIPWIKFPTSSFVLRYDKHLEMKFDAFIDENVNKKIPVDTTKLTCIIILKVLEGSDYFITFEGEYIRGCCGSSLGELVKKPFPIKARLIDINFAPSVSIPIQLFNLINHISLNAQYQDGLFESDYFDDKTETIINMLDYNDNCTIDPDVSSIHVGTALLFFLKTLPEKIVCNSAFVSPPSKNDIIECLTSPNNTVFRSMLLFLSNLAKDNKNKLSVVSLAKIFSPILIDEEIFKYNTNKLSHYYPSSFSLLMAFLTKMN